MSNFGDYRIDSEAAGASVHPVCEHILHRLHNVRIAEIQVGLTRSKLMEIILLTLLVPCPSPRREHSLLITIEDY